MAKLIYFSLNNIFKYFFLFLITLSLLFGCGKKGDLERPLSNDGLEAPEISEDGIYKY